MSIVDTGKSMHVEVLLGADGRIEHQVAVGVPVAVDVHRAGIACSGLCIVDSGGADVVVVLVVVGIYHPSHLFLHNIIVVEHVEPVVPAAAQTCITRADVQRVAVVRHLQQVCHAGLAH